MDQSKIGHFLKKLRKEKGITQEEFAEKIGVSGRTVSRWETGSNMPDISLLVDIADFYDVDVREIIEGEKKSEMMNEDIRDTAEKMAVYADAEKSRLLRFAQFFGIIGIIAMSAATIFTCVNYEPSGTSLVTVLLSFTALLSMMVLTLYVTGLLRRIANNRKLTVLIIVFIAIILLIVLRYIFGLLFVLAFLVFDFVNPMKRVEGIENYDRSYLVEEFSGDMTSHFFLFPDDLDEAEDAEFWYEYKTGLLDTDGSFFLTAVYSDEEFVEEIERISEITCTVSDGEEDITQSVIYDEDMYNYPAYIAIDGYTHNYEYALIDDEDNRIIYVLLGYPDYEELSEYRDYLKSDPSEYDFENGTSLDRFCIYAVRSKLFDGCCEYDGR
ncbi:MAG: helix-turn-helix domain-containing protein [Lachnospiraceae bacterium]|nr:helix-turn-helix domain-containing protein [Lachnospiraceae bacterium]